MSEPIELYNQKGELVILHGRFFADEQIEKGLLFEAPPLVVEVAASPPEKTVTTRRRRTTKKKEA